MSHYAALHLAEGYESADRRALIGGDAGARLRHIDDAACEVDAVRHEQAPDRVTSDDTAVTAVLRRRGDMTDATRSTTWLQSRHSRDQRRAWNPAPQTGGLKPSLCSRPLLW